MQNWAMRTAWSSCCASTRFVTAPPHSAHSSVSVPWCQGVRVSGCQGVRMSGCPGASVSKGPKEEGREGWREGGRERERERARASERETSNEAVADGLELVHAVLLSDCVHLREQPVQHRRNLPHDRRYHAGIAIACSLSSRCSGLNTKGGNSGSNIRASMV